MAFPVTKLIEPEECSGRVKVTEEMAARLSAGAALVYALYYHPDAAELLKHFNTAAIETYDRACRAFGLYGAGGH